MKPVTLSVVMFFLFSCSSPTIVVNDFFGIKMTPSEEKYFEIATYDEKSGASFRQSPNMDADLSAWAEILDKKIRVKIINNTDKAVASDYINDHFVIVTKDGKEYEMLKGRGIDYPSKESIIPHSELDYTLSIPARFRDTQRMTVQETNGTDFTQNYWQGQNELNTQKDNIRSIRIKLSSGDIIILKPVPPPPLPEQ